MLFMVKVDDLAANEDKFAFSKYRLTDFDVNYQFDSHNFGEEHNLTELRGGDAEDGGADPE